MDKGDVFNFSEWAIVLIVPVFLVFLQYLRENRVTNKREKKIKQKKVINTSYKTALKLLINSNFKSIEDKVKYFKETLVLLQRIVKVILDEEGIIQDDNGTIGANIMMRKENPDRLELRYFGVGTDGHGCEGFTLQIDAKNPDIGAPEACVRNVIIYISDTSIDDYQRYFLDEDVKDVKSFISIPIRNKKKWVYAILNIDSDIANQFISSDFIEKQILPEIEVFLYLIKLGHEFFED